jgi:nucleoid-associated protein YejK
VETCSMYYQDEELKQALVRTRVKIDKITECTKKYTRGKNDCFAFIVAYDEELRGKQSKVRGLITFKWESTRDFLVKMARAKLTVEGVLVACNYEVVASKRPKLGDIAYESSCMVNDGKFWISTNEDNTGTTDLRQVSFLERKATLARPIKDL